jgi:glycosyltransferase involved in cell wall biosynthesis
VRISVVIPMRNAADTIDAQLEGLASQDYSGAWEVIVADNGSRDGSAQLAAAWADRLPELRVIDASERRGVSYARNAALRAARGDVIACCDADDVVQPGWLSSIALAIPKWDLVGGPINWTRLSRAKMILPRPKQQSGLRGDFGFLPFALGCNCGMRTEVVRELGGWNEDYIDGGEDAELGWRAQIAGHTLGFAEGAVVLRRQRATLRGLARQFFDYGRAQPRLYKQFRGYGMARTPWYTIATRWLLLAGCVWALLLPSPLARRWVRIAGMCAGRVAGSIQNRVLFL